MRGMRIIRRVGAHIKCAWLGVINRFGRSAITVAGGPVVSLTTYGGRLKTVYLCIESIAQGDMLPSRIILWLDEETALTNLPASLRRLAKRGLEIRPCHNVGPHKKYYPYLMQQNSFERPLVTADDDVLYPKYWLSGLIEAHQSTPHAVCCFRARVVSLKRGEHLGEYSEWRMCESTIPSFCNIATGVSGVLYPPAFLAGLKSAGMGFATRCPRADDLWLHVQELRERFPVKQVRQLALNFPEIPCSQNRTLWATNGAGGNDEQISATYEQADINLLKHGG